MSDNALLALMRLIMNDSRLFGLIRRISGCGPITYFDGRVYAFHSGSNHYDRWHSDASDGRQIGISVNLSECEFQGGIFQLRRGAFDVVHWSIANTGPGDAILFRVRDDLFHRVTAVTGPVPRIVYAGWFQGGPDLLTILKRVGGSAKDAHKSLQYTDPVPTT
jgi:2-oxoglutarate-Fe(II)-dependent oxygenase superfamily protein